MEEFGNLPDSAYVQNECRLPANVQDKYRVSYRWQSHCCAALTRPQSENIRPQNYMKYKVCTAVETSYIFPQSLHFVFNMTLSKLRNERAFQRLVRAKYAFGKCTSLRETHSFGSLLSLSPMANIECDSFEPPVSFCRTLSNPPFSSGGRHAMMFEWR